MSIELLKIFRNNRCWSSIKDDEINLLFNKDKANFRKIVSLATDNEKDYSWRAAWLLTRALVKNDKRLSPYILKIIKSIPGKNPGHQRELLKIVGKIKLSKIQEGYLLDICVNIWKDITTQSGTRYYAIVSILNISKRYPDIKKEINYLLEDYYTKTLSPGIKYTILKKKASSELTGGFKIKI